MQITHFLFNPYLRLSKEGFFIWLYISFMDETNEIQLDWTVEQIIHINHENSFVLIEYGTQCVGCFLQKFCTLQSVTEIYKINATQLLADLKNKKGE